MIDIQNPPGRLELGKTGENSFRTLEFDVSAWLTEYPTGVVSILFERPDGVVYPVLINATENPASWTVSMEDLCAAGEGRVEVQITDDEIIGKSVTMRTYTYAGIDITGAVPAATRTDWLNTVLTAAQRAETACEAAEEAAQEAAAAVEPTHITLANSLTETVAGKALDATQGKILSDSIAALDFGDMQSALYDINGDGVVDAADSAVVAADSNHLGGKAPTYYLAAAGDASNVTADFTEAAVRANLSGGETLSALFSKIKRFFSDLHAVAFSGNYADLHGKPNSFTPSAHAGAHASGGSDVLTPADIGAGDMSAATYDPSGVSGDAFLASNSRLTGYSKPVSAAAVSATDSVDIAIGKLEKGLEGKLSAAAVSVGGNLAALTAEGGIADSGISAEIGTTIAAKMDKAAAAVSGHMAIFNADGQVVDGGTPSGGVSSVFGRTGAVVAASGDYTPAQVGAAPAAAGVASGGTTGQLYAKASAADFDGEWITPSVAAHAASHASDGADAITPASIGASAASAAAIALPASGTALAANTVYTIPSASPVGTYQFVAPATGWAHGTFTTDSTVAITFATGAVFLGAAPDFNASSRYEFDVLDGVWAIAEVVSA